MASLVKQSVSCFASVGRPLHKSRPSSSQLRSLVYSPLRLQFIHSLSSLRYTPLVSSNNSRIFCMKSSLSESDVTAKSGESDESSEESFLKNITKHQKEVAKLTPAEDSRTIIDNCSRALLSTISKKYEGYPIGSLVTYVPYEDGSLLFSFSSLSMHTANIEENPRCSVLISQNPLDVSETLLTLIGEVYPVPESEIEFARKTFLNKHPDASWVDFGDFRFLKFQPQAIRYSTDVASFLGASIFQIPVDEFKKAKPDSIAPFSSYIAKHMNEDHGGSIIAIVRAEFDELEVPFAKILFIDRLGLLVDTKLRGMRLRVRIPFPRPAESRKDVKELIIQLLNESKPKLKVKGVEEA